MEIGPKLLKQIDETRYLNTENAWRYRTILRMFYYQYEKMKYWLYKEDVFDELKKHEEFSQYTMDLVKQDLDTLVQWRNLIPVQDTSKVATVEEFKNKQFRYQLSEYSVEIERLTIKLENLLIESASLEPSLLEKIRIDLEKFSVIATKDIKKIGVWWNSLNSDFKSLNQNYQDYIRDFYSLKAEEMMKTKEFLVFKDKFIDYLRDFIKGLQYNANAIESILKDISSETEQKVFEKILAYEKSVPRLDLIEVLDNMITDNIHGRWQNLKSWFLGDGSRESESSRLLDVTNEIIRKITRFASQISESRNSAANRKEEYKKLCSMFLKCSDIDEAHKLSSLCFGIFTPRHIKGNSIRKTESINSGIYEEEAFKFSIKPRIRYYKEKSEKSAIVDKSYKKSEALEKIIKHREDEKRIIEGYIFEDTIDFSRLSVIDENVRATLLRWLTKGINSTGMRSKTEFGQVFRVIPPDDRKQRCILQCSDGNLEMPPFKIKFEQGYV